MIDNQLKECCNSCNFADINAETSVGEFITLEGECKTERRTFIYCRHQYVCKNYLNEKNGL